MAVYDIACVVCLRPLELHGFASAALIVCVRVCVCVCVVIILCLWYCVDECSAYRFFGFLAHLETKLEDLGKVLAGVRCVTRHHTSSTNQIHHHHHHHYHHYYHQHHHHQLRP